MPQVVFTPNLRRHVSCPTQDVAGTTVAIALQAVFRGNPALRGYVLDDQARLRQHVTIFIDGNMIVDRTTLSDTVNPDSEIFVMQALSGG